MGDEEWFGAAAVEASGAGDGFELFELAGAEPAEVGGHPFFQWPAFAMMTLALRRSFKKVFTWGTNASLERARRRIAPHDAFSIPYS